jgi:serine/threonine-protein kinase
MSERPSATQTEADPRLAATMAGAPPPKPGTSTASGFLRASVLPRTGTPTVAPEADERPRFRPLQPLGAGGIGEVVLVEDHDIDRRVAIKRLRPEQRSAPAIARFAEEVRIIGQLEHPNIMPVHDVGVDEEGQHYFVMKYVQGDTMDAVIARLKAGDPATLRRFTPEHRTEVFVGVLNAVHYAHSRGVIHRDIKPSNIMIGPYGEVTLMDWGIAKRIGSADGAATSPAGGSAEGDPRARTQAGALIGTPMYMSPEQAAGENDRVDQRSDVYSLAITYYEWMTLIHPHADKPTVESVLAAVIGGTVDPRKVKLAFAAAGVPCELGQMIARGLEPDPARRFQSVAEMIDTFHGVQAGNIPVTCHLTFVKRASRELVHFVDRRPVLFSALFFGGLVSVGAGAIALLAHFFH